jgi:FkbM family methyltransferase
MALVHTKAGVEYCLAEGVNPWFRGAFPAWEPGTFRVFERVANPDKVALDIGAWIGATGVWLGKRFKHVVCVEADVESLRCLRANLAASGVGNATVVPQPIHATHQRMFFGPNASQDMAQTLNDSTSQVKTQSTSALDYGVDTVTLADLPMLEEVAFVKVDIEGSEEAILADLVAFCKPRRVPLLLSFHVPWWRDQRLERFAALFEGATARFDETLDVVADPCAFVRSRGGFTALLFEF